MLTTRYRLFESSVHENTHEHIEISEKKLKERKREIKSLLLQI